MTPHTGSASRPVRLQYPWQHFKLSQGVSSTLPISAASTTAVSSLTEPLSNRPLRHSMLILLRAPRRLTLGTCITNHNMEQMLPQQGGRALGGCLGGQRRGWRLAPPMHPWGKLAALAQQGVLVALPISNRCQACFFFCV